MPGRLYHEELYRGKAEVEKLARVQLVLCGAGALGSQLADNLVRQGFARLRVIDRDRIEEHNVGTQLYGLADVGSWKVECLQKRLFRTADVEIEAVRKELTAQNARSLLKDADVIIDAFDNSAARQLVQDYCRSDKRTALHLGLSADYGEIIWDERYRVPQDVAGDVCDYPLARNLILAVVALASEVLTRAFLSGVRENLSFTLRDYAVRQLE